MAQFSINKFNKLLKRFLRCNLLIFTILVCAIAVNSSDLFEFKNLPEENFVDIKLSKEFMTTCENDTGAQISECKAEKILFQSSASGVVFDFDDENSFILTADHFCNPDELLISISSQDDPPSDIWITDHNGRSMLAEIVYSDPASDLCLLKSKLKVDTKIPLSNSMPKVGEKVYSIEAPLSIRPKGVSLHFEGIFSGCQSKSRCFFTIPSESGSSGSLILNSDGEIVGMIQMTIIDFNAVSIGAGIESIRSFLEEASLEMRLSL